MSAKRVVAGFIPLLDCAALVAAAECGFASREGLDLRLVRETSWANIRDRLTVGQFDAAHVLGPVVVAATLGIGRLRVPMVAGAALGYGGNAVAVSNALYAQMHADSAGSTGLDPAAQGAALRRTLQERARRGEPPPVLATVFPFSCHNYELRYWLSACGMDPDQDVQLVVLPPPLLVDAMRAGQIDGFCVGEPWSSVAVAAGVGHVITTATQIWHQPPEKVLGMRRDWMEQQPDVALSLVRAVLRASQWCDDAANHRELASLLAGPRYVGVPADLLHAGLSGRLRLSANGATVTVPDFMTFARDAANQPLAAHALWYYRQMVRWGQYAPVPDGEAAAAAAFDGVLFQRAAESLGWVLPSAARKERFFDGQTSEAVHVAGA